jgi:hypothetical protein
MADVSRNAEMTTSRQIGFDSAGMKTAEALSIGAIPRASPAQAGSQNAGGACRPYDDLAGTEMNKVRRHALGRAVMASLSVGGGTTPTAF